MTATTRRAVPFDPRKLLHDALLAEKAKLLDELPQALVSRRLVVREEISACNSLLARYARVEQESRT